MPPGVPARTEPRLQRVSDPADLRAVWTRMSERSGNLFATWEWLSLWWRHLGRGRLEVWRLGDGPEPTALFPLHVHDGTLRFLGAPHGDELGPVAAPRERTDAAYALGRLLRDDAVAGHRFLGDDLPADVPWEQATGATITRRTASPLLRLEGGWDDFLAARSRNFRAQVRARERRARAHGMTVRLADDPARLGDDLDTLFALHRARWGREYDRGFAAGPSERFNREFAALALRRGWLRLRLLEGDGRPAAALLSFRFAGSEWFYQGGRDPTYDRLSPGFVVHLHAIREAFADGLHAYRLLRGDEPYKRRLADADPGLVSLRLEPRG